MPPSDQPIWQRDAVVAHAQTLARSFRVWTGHDLLPGLFNRLGLSRNLFEAPFALVSHGTESDPILNYGNLAALQLWEMSWDELTRTPSRLTAEAPNREERARILETVTRNGYITGYSGIRISKTGKRFRISNAIVWNVVTEKGELCGQAAMFDRWNPIA